MRQLLQWAAERGYSIGWGAPDLLDQIRSDLSRRRAASEFDQAFFERSLSGFSYLAGTGLSTVECVGVVAAPGPGHLLRFWMEERPVDVVIPPTYLNNGEAAQRVIAALNTLTDGPNAHFARLHAPLKSLATRLGVASYGRNNITYVGGMGSYHLLIGFVTDLKLGPPPARPASSAASSPALSARCAGCSACQKACPTGAIGGDRFLLRAERCLTYFNEYEDPWPDWLPAQAHNCLIGCLYCQAVCPQNAGLLRFERVPEEITAVETALVMAEPNDRDGHAWRELVAKLTRLGLGGDEHVLGRNLKALLAAGSPRPFGSE